MFIIFKVVAKSILVKPIILFCIFVAPAKAQIKSQIFPNGSVYLLENQSIDVRNIPSYKVPRINTNELLIEDLEEKDSGRPFRFGKAIDVNIDFFKLSVKEVRQDTVLYYYSISSSDAHSLNLIFDKFYLSENASLVIYSMDGSMIYGPVKHDHNPENSVFWTDLIKGDKIIIQVKIIGKDSGESIINIEKVIHGYINTFSGFDQSAPCNRDISCPEGSQWRQDGNSVAMLLLENGQRFCSGVLLNNTCNDFTNNFLTAFHCLDSNQNGELTEIERNQVNNWVFRFMYESPNCNGNDGVSFQSINGSIFRSAFQPSDFALLELNSSPSGETTYAGWSRSNVSATSGVAIHHPNGDVKKISIENDNLTNVPIWTTWVRDFFGNPVVECPPNTHWQAIFDSPGIGIDPSTVQPGSSGSPIFNQNHQVVGQLHGDYLNTNNDFCDNRRGQYGRFDVSWGRDDDGFFLPGRNPTNSLAPWLDPNNTSAMTTNTIPLPTFSGPDFLCSTASFSLQNPPTGSTVSWSVSPTNLFSGATSGTGATANLSPVSSLVSGSATLTFSVTSDCGVVSVDKDIWVGMASSPSINGPYEMQINSVENFYAGIPNYPFNLYFDWQVYPTGNEWLYGQGEQGIILSFSSGGVYSVSVDLVNPCGARGSEMQVWVYNPWDMFMVYPNPTTDFTTITKKSNPIKSTIESNTESFEVSLFDPRGQEIIGRNKSNTEAILDLSKLKKGLYYIHIYYKDAVIRKQIKVE